MPGSAPTACCAGRSTSPRTSRTCSRCSPATSSTTRSSRWATRPRSRCAPRRPGVASPWPTSPTATTSASSPTAAPARQRDRRRPGGGRLPPRPGRRHRARVRDHHRHRRRGYGVGVTYPWPAGAATGIGSLPGTDFAEAVKIVFGEVPDFPHLPELPARGPGADMIGRGAGLLVDLPVEIYAGRWRVTARPGRDARVTRDLLERDLDAVTEHAAEYTGPLKVASAGPWTLASSVQLPVGGALLRHPGAVRDLAASLAEGLRDHVADVAARLPGATVVLQLDEPSLPAVLAGRVPTESGFSTLPAPEPATVQGALAGIVETVSVPVVVHCCAAGVPVGLVRETGAVAIAIDLDQAFDLDQMGEALDAGLGLLAGAAPALPPPSGRAPSSAEVAEKVLHLWRRLGFPAERLASQVVVTPACGLAGAPEDYARRVLTACREAGQRLLES